MSCALDGSIMREEETGPDFGINGGGGPADLERENGLNGELGLFG